MISRLTDNGLTVSCFGGGWENGRVSQEKMLEIFSNSKINLNLPLSSDRLTKKAFSKLFIYRRNDQTYHLYNPIRWIANLRSLLHKNKDQIKGRVFEVPGTGGFLITGDADNIGDYYVDGKEMVIFKDIDELIQKVKYYLEHEDERKAIAMAGYERTLREHTYEKRFHEIFSKMSLLPK
jgi:spore maturation protein CgeB